MRSILFSYRGNVGTRHSIEAWRCLSLNPPAISQWVGTSILSFLHVQRSTRCRSSHRKPIGITTGSPSPCSQQCQKMGYSLRAWVQNRIRLLGSIARVTLRPVLRTKNIRDRVLGTVPLTKSSNVNGAATHVMLWLNSCSSRCKFSRVKSSSRHPPRSQSNHGSLLCAYFRSAVSWITQAGSSLRTAAKI